jgi:hypothetical protein
VARFGRFTLSEISLNRLLFAVKVRLGELPPLAAWKFSSLARENQARLEQYQDKHLGGRCFIVANGPSLNKTNLDFLSEEITFGLNRIYLNFQKSLFRPTYYAAVNELILEQFTAEVSNLSMPKFLNWNRRSYFDHRDPDIIFIKSKMVVNDFFQPDITKPLVVGGTVTFVALQVAFYMGFQKVVLVGLDHQYAEKGIPNRTEARAVDRDESHFHPDYFPKGARWQLPDLLRSEIDFKLARRAYENDGREVIDATIGGKCPVFKRAEYLSLFEGTGNTRG